MMKKTSIYKHLLKRKFVQGLTRLERLHQRESCRPKNIQSLHKRLRRYHRRLSAWGILPAFPTRLALVAQLLLGAAVSHAQQPISLGGDQLVNTNTVNDQSLAAMAMDENGDFVVTWTGAGLVGDEGTGIYAQLYDAVGTPVGSEIHVNTYTTSYQLQPSVAMDADGDFVVAWGSLGQDGSSYGIYFQRFDKNGVKVGLETRANRYTTNSQSEPDVAMAPDGDFVIVWETQTSSGGSTSYRRYDRFGNSLVSVESEWQLGTVDDSYNPAVAMDAVGGFVITCQDGASGQTNGIDIWYERFDQFGNSLNLGGLANSSQAFDQKEPDVAMDLEGEFVIAWESSGNVWMRRFGVAGNPLAADVNVSNFQTHPNKRPAVAMDKDGDFVVSYSSYLNNNSGSNIAAKSYNQDGILQYSGGTWRINDYQTGFQSQPTIGMDAAGDFVIAWSGEGADDPSGVYMRRYQAAKLELTCSDVRGAYHLVAKVAMDPDGDFVIVSAEQRGSSVFSSAFHQYNNLGGLENESDISTERALNVHVANDLNGNFTAVWNYDSIHHRGYTAAGNPVIPAQAIPPFNTYSSGAPAIAMDSEGDYVVVISGKPQGLSTNNIYAQRVSANHVPIGPVVQINSYTTGNQNAPSVAMEANGDFVVVWESIGQDGNELGVYARRYSADGNPVGGEFRVNDTTTGSQSDPVCAMDEDGDFVVAWVSNHAAGSSKLVYQKRFDRNGFQTRAEARITSGSLEEKSPAAAMSPAGEFVIAYQRDDKNIGMALFSDSGVLLEEDQRINPYFSGYTNHHPDVAMDEDGDFVIIWSSVGEFALNYELVYKQLYKRHSGNCSQEQVYLGNIIPTDVYQAGAKLTALGEVESGSDVHFKAGNNILLDEGFEVKLGADLLAEIEGCN